MARAAARVGHAVAFSGRRSALDPEFEFDVFPSGTERTPKRVPLRVTSLGEEQQAFRDGFAGWIARARAAEVFSVGADWRPDVVVCDETDYGAMVAAERLGLPHVTVLVLASDAFVPRDLVPKRSDLVLTPFPPSLRPLGAAQGFRLFADVAARAAAPTVYFTLGTVFNLESGDLFTRVLAGLRQLDVDVVATVGRQIDPAELGPQPERVRVERWLPHSDVLPRCSAVVSHGGSGSVLAALAHGLPSVLLPMGADQPLNAARCAELGVALVLDPLGATPQDVAEAVETVLSDASYRAAAEGVRDEIRALPVPEHALALLERLIET